MNPGSGGPAIYFWGDVRVAGFTRRLAGVTGDFTTYADGLDVEILAAQAHPGPPRRAEAQIQAWQDLAEGLQQACTGRQTVLKGLEGLTGHGVRQAVARIDQYRVWCVETAKKAGRISTGLGAATPDGSSATVAKAAKATTAATAATAASAATAATTAMPAPAATATAAAPASAAVIATGATSAQTAKEGESNSSAECETQKTPITK